VQERRNRSLVHGDLHGHALSCRQDVWDADYRRTAASPIDDLFVTTEVIRDATSSSSAKGAAGSARDLAVAVFRRRRQTASSRHCGIAISHVRSLHHPSVCESQLFYLVSTSVAASRPSSTSRKRPTAVSNTVADAWSGRKHKTSSRSRAAPTATLIAM